MGTPDGQAAIGSASASGTGRGSNWGLPSRSPGAVAYTRPIRIACLPDRLVIVPPRGSEQQPAVTAMQSSTDEALDRFITSIWSHMRGWGIAGRNAYWKPILNVEVAPGAEGRWQDLTRLLQGSGLQLRRVNN